MSMTYVENPGLLTSEQAEEILEPYRAGLLEDFRAAWTWAQTLLDADVEYRLTLDTSTQAAIVFNRFVRLTMRRYDGHEAVKVRRSGRMMTINFGGGLFLRFKKFDDQLRSHNVKTNSQAEIYYQLRLRGMDPATRVTFGYRTDATGRNVAGLHITCPVGWSRNKWVITLDEAKGNEALPFAAPAPAPQDAAPGFVLEPLEPQQKKTHGA
jgi:hypothetical protein